MSSGCGRVVTERGREPGLEPAWTWESKRWAGLAIGSGGTHLGGPSSQWAGGLFQHPFFYWPHPSLNLVFHRWPVDIQARSASVCFPLSLVSLLLFFFHLSHKYEPPPPPLLQIGWNIAVWPNLSDFNYFPFSEPKTAETSDFHFSSHTHTQKGQLVDCNKTFMEFDDKHIGLESLNIPFSIICNLF